MTATVGTLLRDAGSFVRFPAMGATLLIALLGAASATPGLSAPVVPGLLAAAAALHVYGYVLNDVADLPIDRSDPRRASGPLVRGSIHPWHALAVAVTQVPVACWLTARLGGDSRALGALSASVTLGAAYNLCGKRTRLPQVTDAIQGLAWAAVALWGAAVAGRWTPLSGAVAAFVGVSILMVNAMHGGLRDLASDARSGVRSTAIAMGARPGTGGGLVVPLPLRRYAAGLQVTLTAIALAAVLAAGEPGGRWLGRVAALVAIALLATVSAACLAAAARALDDPAQLRSAGMVHLIALLALPIAMVAPRLPGWLLAVLVTAYLVPTTTNRWLPDALRWGARAVADRPWHARARGLADFVTLVRAENCLATAAAVLLGGYLSGGTAVLRSGQLARAGLVAALTVAAVDVANDRQDVAVDTHGKADRPLPSGRVSTAAAGRLLLALVAASTVVGMTMGARLAGVAAVLLLLGLAYCYRLKDTVLLGNAVVALLAASTVMFGAVVAGRLTAAAVLASALTMLFMLSFEVLKTVADRDADSRAGLRTVATVWGTHASLLVHRLAGLAFTALALLPWRFGLASPGYGWGILLTGILPMVAAVYLPGRGDNSSSIQTSINLMKVAWFPGLLTMALLR